MSETPEYRRSQGDSPFLEISHKEVWGEIQSHSKTTGEGGHADHENRIRKLEWEYRAMLAGLVTGLVSAIVIVARGG
jgi:hypothetical protein